MTETGIFFRRACKSVLEAQPPKPGEMVFATDTGEHGWLDENNILVWKLLLQDKGGLGGSTGLELIYEDGVQGWRLIGKNAIKYAGTGKLAVDISESQTSSGASGDYSFAASYNTIAQNTSQTSIGQFNKGISTTTILEIGIGTEDTNRANALEVTSSGGVYAPNFSLISQENSDDSLITNAYFKSKAGLERLTEDGVQGWRLFLADPLNYGPIGHKAIDLSTSIVNSGILGATGLYSFASGINNESKGTYSTSTGAFNKALGSYSTAMGSNTIAPADAMVAFGKYNVGTDLTNILEIGYGKSDTERKNIFEVKQEGQIIAPDLGLAEISDARCLITLEYFNANKTGKFITLPDTPNTYVPNNFVVVNSSGTALEFVDAPEGLISQLQIIYEDGRQGWRLYGKDATLFGDIGHQALDFTDQQDNTYRPHTPDGERGAVGAFSVAFGLNSNARGNYSIAQGSSLASGDYSFSIGDNYAIASGNYSYARGRKGTPSGSTIASGAYSTAIGRNSKAEGSFSTAIGTSVAARASNSFVVGTLSTATGNTSVSFGYNVDIGGDYSLSSGFENYTSGNYSATFGYGLLNPSEYCTVVGKYNRGVNVGNVFEVGNGYTSGVEDDGGGDAGIEETRTNALEVHRTGLVKAPRLDSTAYTNPSQTDPKLLVTLEYLKVYYAASNDGTGLELVGEAGNQGWRFIGTEPDFYGDIGEKAVDFSYNNVPSTTLGATGDYSVAFGSITKSTGAYSVAFGYNNDAKGEGSTVFGKNNLSGYFSNTFGLDNINDAYYSTMFGRSNYSIGTNNFIAGTGLYSNKDSLIVLGNYNLTNPQGRDSILEIGIGSSNSDRKNGLEIQNNGQVLAPETDVEEFQSPKALVTKEYVDFYKQGTGLEKVFEEYSSLGIYKTGWRFIGIDSTTRVNIGEQSVDLTTGGSGSSGAYGDYSIAMGFETNSDGRYSFASGYKSRAAGNYSTAIGIDTYAWGESSFSSGRNTQAGHYAAAFGYGVYASTQYSLACGLYNSPKNENVFEVGYGSSNSRFNIFEVVKTGQVYAHGLDINEIVDPKCLITKEYFDAYNSGQLNLLINDNETDLDTTWSSTYIDFNMASKLYVQNSTHILDDLNVRTNKTWSSSLLDSKITPLASKLYVDNAIGQISIDSGFDDLTVSLFTGWSSQKITDTFPTYFEMDTAIADAVNGATASGVIDDTAIASTTTWSSLKINDTFNGYASKTYVDSAIAAIDTTNIIDDTVSSTTKAYSSSYINANFATPSYVTSTVSSEVSAVINDSTVSTSSGWSSSNLNTKFNSILNDSLTNTSQGWSSTKIQTELTAIENLIQGSNGDLKSDGSVPMATGYTPTLAKDILTLEYFQNNSSGDGSFIGLTDTPASFTADQWVKVNASGTALEYVNAPVADLGNVLLKDGSVPLNGIYVPINDQDIATKTYVDNATPVIDFTPYLKKDGTVTMDVAYTPSLATDIVTKAYLEANVAGSADFSGLTDTPAALVADQWVKVNAGGTALEYVDAPIGEISNLAYNVGWYLANRIEANYGNVGANAMDLSFSNSASTTYGATGSVSFATGFNATASGPYATAMGTNATASGRNSTAIGLQSTASATYATALGIQSTASANYATAFSRQSIASGVASFATAYSTASGKRALAMVNGDAISDYSVAIGGTATANYAYSIGNFSSASGESSLALGQNAETTQLYATAIGRVSRAQAIEATAIGSYVYANNAGMTAIGAYNAYGKTDTMFEVGIGTSAGVKNGLEIFGDGRVIAPELTIITDPKSLITKEYLEANAPASDFSALTDTPVALVAGQWLKVADDGLSIEYVDAPITKNPRTRFTATESQTVFDAGFTVEADSIVYVDGIMQPPRNYTISGTSIIMEDFMTAGTDILIML